MLELGCDLAICNGTMNQQNGYNLAAAVWLMGQTATYQNYTVADLHRLLFPPISLEQYRVYYLDGRPHGFASWAFLTPEARDGYLERTRKLQPGDWNAGDELWFIDFIAPFGGVRAIVRDLYKVHAGAQVAFAARTYGTGQVQRTGRFNNAQPQNVE